MALFVTLMNWTDQGVKSFKDSVDRGEAAKSALRAQGVDLKEIYWTVGPYDIVSIVDLQEVRRAGWRDIRPTVPGYRSSPRGRPRHCFTATNSSSAPSASLRTLTHFAGSPPLLAFAPLEMSSTTVPRIARPSTQPSRNAGPLARARGVASISTTPMIGNGLIVTPTAKARI